MVLVCRKSVKTSFFTKHLQQKFLNVHRNDKQSNKNIYKKISGVLAGGAG
jgi:hypothetical protein